MDQSRANSVNKWRRTVTFKEFDMDAGTLRYVDEGTGEPVVFVHGNPTSSFMFRDAIFRLRDRGYRCLAPDHLGFGRSDKPADWSYRPWDHASNLKGLIDDVGIDEFHLVVHDWGGPIGLSVALDRPEAIMRLTLMNTWMWSLSDRLTATLFSYVLGSQPGRYLIERWDLFTNVLMKAGVSRRQSLSEPVHRYYREAFEQGSRKGVWRFPKDIVDASDWLEELWNRRHLIRSVPVLLAWGMRDPAFTRREMNRWIEFFETVRERRYHDASHYVMEDRGGEVSEAIEAFLTKKY